MDELLLVKTNRINMLFDFYGLLLTNKQQMFLQCYFQDDFSFGEIATNFGISRQAVYEHIKRAEQTLETYEYKLQLLSKFIRRVKLMQSLQHAVNDIDSIDQRKALQRMISELQALDEGNGVSEDGI